VDVCIYNPGNDIIALTVNRIVGLRQFAVFGNRHHFALVNRQAGIQNPVVSDNFTIGYYRID